MRLQFAPYMRVNVWMAAVLCRWVVEVVGMKANVTGSV